MSDAGNGKVPDANPVASRRPLHTQIDEVDSREPQSPAVRKIADAMIAIVTRVDAIDRDLVALGSDAIMGFVALSAKMDRVSEALTGGVPPMRRREDSAHALDEMAHVVSEVAHDKAQRLVDDPGEDLTPTAVQTIVNEAVLEALTRQKEAERVKQLEAAAAKVEADRIEKGKADERKRKERREFWRLTISGIVVGLVVLAVTAYVSHMEGRLAEHQVVVEEATKIAATAAPLAPPPAASGPPVGAPATAPATVAPASHPGSRTP